MRAAWLALGAMSVVIGAAGAVLPLLPTTPFLLVGVYAFSKSSPALATRLIEHPSFGQPIRDWQRQGAIGRRAKRIALATVVATPLASWIAGLGPIVLIVQTTVLAGVAVFVATRPEPSPLSEREP